MKRCIFLVLVILVISSLSALSLDELICKLQNKYNNIKTYEANINQINYFKEQDISLESKGKLFIENEAIVLEYTDPFYQFMKSESNLLTLYSKNENTAFISQDNNPVTSSVLHFSSLVNQDFLLLEKENNLFVYKLSKPVEPISDMKIFVSKDAIIEKIVYSDDLNNIITIEISKQIFNKKLSRSISDFVIPDNATVIE